MTRGTNPSKEKMHVLWSRVDDHVLYLLAFDFLEHGSVGLRVCLSEVHLEISVARRSHELPQFDETCEMQNSVV